MSIRSFQNNSLTFLSICVGALGLAACEPELNRTISAVSISAVIATPVQATATSSSWTTTDAYQKAGTQDSAANAVFQGADGSTLTVGGAEDGNAQLHWIVRQKTVSAPWATIDDFQYAAPWDSSATGALMQADGTLWAVGSGIDAIGVSHWIVRKQPVSGAWVTSDDFQLQAGTNSVATGITVDAGGKIYVVGYGVDSSHNQHWIVRAKNGVAAWAPEDDFQGAGSTDAFARSIGFDSGSGKIYVAGTATTAGTLSWIVRVKNAGVWSTSDTFQLSAGHNASGVSVTVDASGNPYATGFSKDASGIPHWITRGKIGAGAWTTSDDYQQTASQAAYGAATFSDSSGAVYAAGNALDSGSSSRWTVRSISGGTWSSLDEIQNGASENSFARAIYSNAAGKISVCGVSTDATSATWLLREYD